jgi:hypothetical protein
MATAQLIDLSNYDTLLVQSTQGRSGTPDGNIFFDVANGRIELITAEELANVDLGGGAEANPLTNQFGIKKEALYAFENQERRTDETLRQYDRYFKGTFKFGGAYEIINGRKYDDADGSATSSTTDDRAKIRGSGWIERNSANAIGRIYYGVRSLGTIEETSQPYYQLTAGGAPTNFQKDGAVDEAIQVYGDAVVDTNTTTFDSRTYMSMKVRTFGYNYDEKTLEDSGVTQMDGYASGFALGESPHLTTGNYTLANVYGGGQISPWTGMTLEKLATPQTETGFNEADGDFTWVLNNTVPGDLDQCVAFLDALAQTDDDIDSGSETVTNGKRVGTWYTYDAQGRIVTRSGADSLGLFIENIPTADEQLIVFTDDAGNTKTRPFQVSVVAEVGAIAVADILSWYHSFFEAAYNTAGAVTVQDASAAEVKGNVSTDATGNNIEFAFDYDGDTVGGTAGTDKDCVFICEGDGGATQAKTLYTITRQTTVSFSCAPAQENNA